MNSSRIFRFLQKIQSLKLLQRTPAGQLSTLGCWNFSFNLSKLKPITAFSRHLHILHCSANFESFIGCIKEVTRVCEHSWRSDAWIDLDVRLKFQKRFYCENGALILPFAVCGKNYLERGPQCVQSFRKTFRDNITDSTTLCEWVLLW